MKSPSETTDKKPKASLRSQFMRAVDSFAFPLRTSHYVELVNPLWSTPVSYTHLTLPTN